MSVESTIGMLAPGAAPEAPSSNPELQQRVKRMAQEFEAMLMTQMLREMRQSMLSDGEDEKGLGAETMTDSIDVELGRVLSQAGGFGLATALSRAVGLRGGDSNTPAPLPPFNAGAAPVAAPRPAAAAAAAAASAPVPPAGGEAEDEGTLHMPRGRVSSSFGWRHDPFTGASKFHQGIDVAQAYGQDVRAAASGRVTFAGDQGSYGTTIVIEHAGGRQTRYAHLSVTDVRPGDLVDPGQVIGKSGSSGRSTGPHLHFEVLDRGRPVNPTGA